MRVLQSGLISPVVALLLMLAGNNLFADDDLKQKFNQKYRDFLSQTSQALLPLPELSKADWLKLRQSRALAMIYSDPDKFYNSKTYTFTLYQATDDGSYYLDAKGGFWGMDELIYGPLSLQNLQ